LTHPPFKAAAAQAGSGWPASRSPEATEPPGDPRPGIPGWKKAAEAASAP